MPIEELFQELIKNLQKEDEKKLKKILEKINKLDRISKKLFLNELYLDFSNIYNRVQLQNCAIYGHEFSEWKRVRITEKECMSKGNGFSNIFIEKTIYERTCVECGLKEKSFEDPKQKVKTPQK